MARCSNRHSSDPKAETHPSEAEDGGSSRRGTPEALDEPRAVVERAACRGGRDGELADPHYATGGR